MTITLTALQKQRRDTAANWTAENPTLLAGEIGIESDTGKIKIGTGAAAWNSLAYQGIIPSSGAYPLSQLIMPLGTAAAPAVTFTGDVNTGIYSSGADQVSFSTGGTERLRIDATGQIEAVSLGTAAAPTYTFTGDQNTGIYSPGADQLAISTGGSGRLFVDASGRILVGTASSSIGGSGSIILQGSAGPGVVRAAFGGTSPGSTDILGAITFTDSSHTGAAYIYGSRDGGTWTSTTSQPSAITFGTTPNGSGTAFERLRITSAGLVGVGTSSPSSLLTVGGNPPTAGAIAAVGASGGIALALSDNVNSSLYVRTALGGAVIGTDAGGVIRFATGGNATTDEKMRITAAGLVGIGTSSPQALLDLAAAAPTIQFTDTTSVGERNWRIGISDIAEGDFNITQETGDDTNTYASRLYISAAGNVGIGTTGASSPLHISADSETQVILNRATTTTGASFLRFTNLGGNYYIGADSSTGNRGFATGGAPYGLVINAEGAYPITFGTTNIERARIDSSGRLLVGTSSARTITVVPTFQIEGTGAVAGAFQSLVLNRNTDAAGPRFAFGRTRGTANGQFTAVQSGDSLGDLRWYGADGTTLEPYAAEIRCEVDGTPGANDMPGRIVLSTTLDGTSSPTEALRITNDRVIGYNQAAPVAVDATATLTVANLKNGIITSTTAAAVTGTLPTGTLTEGGFSNLYTNFTFEWTVINTGATNSFTVAAGTDHTVVGNMVVAAGNSGRFATRRTAANTFVTYRLSS